MLGRAIAGVALEAVTGEAQREAPQQGIALLLSKDAGGSDGGAAAVALRQGDLRTVPATQGQDAIDDHQRERPR
jgi:hypothetical protein